MTDVLREFYDDLNREEAVLKAEIATDRMGLILRVAINELDLDFDGMEQGGTDDEMDHERSYVMRLGVNRIIKLALDAHPRFEAPTLTFCRNPAISARVMSLIAKLGTIDHGRRVAQSVAKGLGMIERRPDGFHVALPPTLIDHEIHERELDRWYRTRDLEVFNDRYEALVEAEIGDDVKSLLGDLVYPYRTHFIGYESDPILDTYFFGHAYNEIAISKGYDTFHFSTRFGGRTFQHYKLAATFIVAVAMKHRAFVAALLLKCPQMRLEDILTVSVETGEFLEGMREFINHFGERQEGHVPVTDECVRTLFEVLSISRGNTVLLDRPGAPIPPLIQCSEGHVIRPLIGGRSDVMLFLLNALQHNFPKEYARAQREREGVMQRAVERLLRPVFPEFEYRTNVRLRRVGKVLTDIDLVIIDPGTGRIILVQMKHQDPYGDDLATRNARTTRLNQQVSDWISKVRGWQASASPNELRSTLRLSASTLQPIVSLFVITRFYAYSLRTVIEGEEVGYANYTQLVTAVARLQQKSGSNLSVDHLMAELKNLSDGEEVHFLPEPPSEWRVGDVRFTIEQSASS